MKTYGYSDISVTIGGELVLTDHRPHPRGPVTLKVDPEFDRLISDACDKAARQLAEHIERATEGLAEGIPLGQLAITAYPNGPTVRRVWNGDTEVGRVVVDYDKETMVMTVRAVRL